MKLAEYARLDATDLAGLVQKKEVTARELGTLALEAIALLNPQLNCVVEAYHARVAQLDEQQLPDGPFKGVPFLVKDLCDWEAGCKTEAGSLLSQGFVAPEDGELVKRLRAAGLVTVGRASCPEQGYSGTCDTRLVGRTLNPWDPARMPGGSSSGSAAAVAAGMVPMAGANDGGGSIRDPAAHCGLVGLKPSRHRISQGALLTENIWNFSTALAVSRSVRDTARLLDALHGPHPTDELRLPAPAGTFAGELSKAPGTLRIAYTTRAPHPGVVLEQDVLDGLNQTVARLRNLGFEVFEYNQPLFEWSRFCQCNHTMWAMSMAKDIDWMGQHMGRTPSPDNLMRTTWAVYESSKRITLKDFMEACDNAEYLRREIVAPFGPAADFDILLTPTAPRVAPRHEEFDQDLPGFSGEAWSDHMFSIACFQAPFNLSGQPAISLPLCSSSEGLPIGMQFVGRFADEASLLRLAALLEQQMPWRGRLPPTHIARLC